MVKNIIVVIVASATICYISYSLGKVNTEFNARKLQKSLTEILDKEESHIPLSHKELIRKIQQMKETNTKNAKELEQLSQENAELKDKLERQKIDIEKIAKKLLEMDVDTIYAKLPENEKPNDFPRTSKEFLNVLFTSIKNGDYNKILRLINTLIDLIVKTNQEYIKVIK